MKLFTVICICLLVGGIEAAHDVSISASVCEQEDCGCQPPRNTTAENIKFMPALGCFCACGKKVKEDCVIDDDCVFGLHCGAGDKLGGFGKCIDACEKPGSKCDIFDRCVINEDGEPYCECKIRACSDILIGSGVCTFDTERNKTIPFNNDCLYINEKCNRHMKGRLALEIRQIAECAVVIEPKATMGPVGVAGWQMSGN